MDVMQFLGQTKQLDVLAIARTMDLPESFGRMSQHHSRSIVVTGDEDSIPVGLLTMTKLAEFLVAQPGASAFRVGQAMLTLKDEHLVHPDTPWLECARLLASDRTHVLIGKPGHPLQSVMTATDIVRWLIRLLT